MTAATRACTVPDCCRPHKARGLCNLHYQRVRKHGDVGDVHSVHDADTLSIAFHTGRIDRGHGAPRRTTRTDAIGQAYADGYESEAA